MNARHRGASAARYATCKMKREDGSDERLSNKTGHAALSVCVGEFSCKYAASPSTPSCDRGVLKRSRIRCQIGLELRPAQSEAW